MTEVTIRTNNVPRDTLDWFSLTDKERAEFDYLDTTEKQDEALFVHYCGRVYDIADFMRVERMPGLEDWDGYKSESFYSGVLIKLVEHGDRVIVGTYCV